MMVSGGRSAPHPIVLATLHTGSGTSPASRACAWSAARCHNIELHCSTLSAHLAGYDDAAYSHILQSHNDSEIRCLGNMHACLENT
jgi:hypothetical protein